MTTREQALKGWNNFGTIRKVIILAKHKVHNHSRIENPIDSEFEELWCKEEETKVENKYLNRLRQEYKFASRHHPKGTASRIQAEQRYSVVRSFCLDTDLIPFNDIEVMEMEVDSVS